MVIGSTTEEVEYLKKIIELNDKQFEEIGCHLPLTNLVSDKIKSLIKKYEDEKYSLEATNIMWHEDVVEMSKIIELMAKDIAHDGFDEDICRAFKQEERTWECNDDKNCELCVIEYYKKKVKGD